MNHKKEETKYVFHVAPDGNLTPHAMVRGSAIAEIPPGVYSLVLEGGLSPSVFLRPESNFKLPERIYGGGKINGYVERFIKSYEINDKNLGIALIGEKGSGKTMLLKALSAKVIEMGLPVILIDEKIPGSLLNWFMSTITQQILVCFDEFEKTYDDKDEQTAILRLLDGTNTGTKKMYCFTVNYKDGVSQYMFGRPSRIRYVLPFKRLEIPTVIDYVQSNLKNCTENHLRAFIHLALCDARQSSGMNFDSMVEFVKEMNQFGGDVRETLSVMGETGLNSWAFYEITGFENGEKKHRAVAMADHSGPYIGEDEMAISFMIKVPRTEEECENSYSPSFKDVKVKLTQENFVGFGDTYDTLIFEKDGVTYHLSYRKGDGITTLHREVEEESSMGKSTEVNPRPGLYQKRPSAALAHLPNMYGLGVSGVPAGAVKNPSNGNPSYGTNG
jgi:hypothetical protein